MPIEDDFEYCDKCGDYFYNPKGYWGEFPLFCVVMVGTVTTGLITVMSFIGITH